MAKVHNPRTNSLGPILRTERRHRMVAGMDMRNGKQL